jgi:hypothetical protein
MSAPMNSGPGTTKPLDASTLAKQEINALAAAAYPAAP